MSERIHPTNEEDRITIARVARTIVTGAGIALTAAGSILGIGEQVFYPDPSDSPVNPVALVVGGIGLAGFSEAVNHLKKK